MKKQVETYLLKKIKKDGAIHFTLLDPEEFSPESAAHTASEAESCGTTAIMVGGSTIASTSHLDAVVKAAKKAVKIPVILFPNNITGISKYADAIWFMSLLNSSDPYFLTGAQILGAPTIRKFGLEPIPLGYVTVGEGGAVSVVGRACPIPYNKPELAVAHALAAQYFGMRFVYLEGGSGVKQPVPKDMIQMVKRAIDISLIVGGGIRSGEQARNAVSAGADAVVTGTVTEEEGSFRDRITTLVKGTKSGKTK
ncbi:MAG: geranylgeranylglyceryl/heptaprenylglyceryl phosphate synthase [Candidatus Bathyarchaeota archaeon]|jgi:phosphoglycerol geranylgeranyltransferase